jgi:hypothetical protein
MLREDKYNRYELIKDPDKENGFSVGSRFSREEIECMTRAETHAFTPGSVLRCKGRYYKIIQEPSLKQRLVPIEALAL